MTSTCFALALSAGGAIVGHHGTSGGQGFTHVALWQVINLVGTPLLAILFLPPVIDDLLAWLRWRREEQHQEQR
jgi:hypothetical protein